MNLYKPNRNLWWLDLPKSYFEYHSDTGLFLGSSEEIEKANTCPGDEVKAVSDWVDYTIANAGSIALTELNLSSIWGDAEKIKIPSGLGRYFCFTDFSSTSVCGVYPSIFEAHKRLVCNCACSSNWDGLSNSSIMTIDIESGRIFNQYWSSSWQNFLKQEIPGIGEDINMWSNGTIQLYLNFDETKLLIHSNYDGNFPASVLFEWTGGGWEIAAVVPGQFPSRDAELRNPLVGFRIGSNSLSRHFSGC